MPVDLFGLDPPGSHLERLAVVVPTDAAAEVLGGDPSGERARAPR